MCRCLSECTFHFSRINPKSATAGSYGNCMFSLLRNCQATFQKGCTALHICQECIDDLVSLHSHQHGVLSLFFNFSHPDRCVVISHHSFNLYSFVDKNVKYFFIFYLYIFSREIFLHAFCLYSK